MKSRDDSRRRGSMRRRNAEVGHTDMMSMAGMPVRGCVIGVRRAAFGIAKIADHGTACLERHQPFGCVRNRTDYHTEAKHDSQDKSDQTHHARLIKRNWEAAKDIN